MALTPVSPNELRLGKPLHQDLFNAHGVLVVRKGTVLETAEQLTKLLALQLFHKVADPTASVVPLLAATRSTDRGNALTVLKGAYADLDALYNRLDKGPLTEDFPTLIKRTARAIIEAYHQNPIDAVAFIFLNMRRGTRYVVRHPINTAILLYTLMQDSFPEEPIVSALCAALTMNLSIMELQQGLSRQTDTLSDDQRHVINSHPLNSMARIKALGVTDPLWLRLVAEHHERADGSGYPRHIQGNTLLPYILLLGFADEYCAKISPRHYRPALNPRATLQQLAIDRAAAFTDSLAADCLRRVGLYPPGSFVRLQNNEIAMVVSPGETPLTPLVYSVKNRMGEKIRPLRRNTAEEGFAIAESVTDSSVGLQDFEWWIGRT